MTSMLIRGYNNYGFEAWTIPTLYMVGKYLRLFAIKSDAERSKQSEVLPTGAAALMQDDFDPETDKQAQLRDCEQHLKRIFTLCLNDRYECGFFWSAFFPHADVEPGRHCKNQESGGYTTSSTCCSKRTSSSILPHCQEQSSRRWQSTTKRETCRL